MSGVALDGKRIKEEIEQELRPRIAALRERKRAPSIAVVLVGDDPASQIYVRSKIKTCAELGITSIDVTPDSKISTEELLDIVDSFNRDSAIDGILVQSPLPNQIDERTILLAIAPDKDVDGFHPFNVGNLVANRPAPRACTPAGIIEMLKRYRISIAGKHAVIVGRSNIVGKPMALMLLHENATVTICHSRTRDLAAECRRADILVAATGKAGLITANHIQPGTVVVDVGMNRITNETLAMRLVGYDEKRVAAFRKNRQILVGDVDPQAMQQISSYYTPVPGGVGPLTIAMLMSNTVLLAEQHLQ
ncbi:MAG: bifunctional methylenetetrahydrofolate dehydrogenase/methenyltetrahydrofolate cyclohydrolase FolD [Acidobacteriaceae bacterium]|nr:bifunctional methylenetetrahydrofolate dehydrogenase/methenyltetrahydrofolate cyclohydrolase FolD [Acidobacteriaceae bacterium]